MLHLFFVIFVLFVANQPVVSTVAQLILCVLCVKNAPPALAASWYNGTLPFLWGKSGSAYLQETASEQNADNANKAN
jgi:hypothetical protein